MLILPLIKHATVKYVILNIKDGRRRAKIKQHALIVSQLSNKILFTDKTPYHKPAV